MKQNLKFYLTLTACAGALLLFEVLSPAPLDWSPSFSATDKIPYGNYILWRLLPHLFPHCETEVVHKPIFEVLSDQSFKKTNYVFINTDFPPDEVEAGMLLDFVAAGNHVFIAAQQFEGRLADTLKVDISRDFFRVDSIGVDFANGALKSGGYRYRPASAAHFSSFDTSRTTILGFDDREKVNFIQVRWDQGSLWLSSMPLAFTNYNLLAGHNRDYIFKALSYLPVQDTLWDEYYKVGRLEAATPIRYILRREPLKWAFCLALVGLGLFILFEGKRRQRIIPVIEPLPNHTLEFVETVGQLYYQQGDHKNIAEKKIKYFLEHIRTHLGVDARLTAGEWGAKLAEKTGVPMAQIAELHGYLQHIRAADALADDELARLNQLLERFHQGSQDRV